MINIDGYAISLYKISEFLHCILLKKNHMHLAQVKATMRDNNGALEISNKSTFCPLF